MCNYPTKFPCKSYVKNVSENVKVVQCDLFELWFILNVTILITQITGIFKTAMNPGTAQNVAAQSFLFTPCLVTKTFWLVVQTLIITPISGQIIIIIIKAYYHENDHYIINDYIIIIIIKTFLKSRPFSSKSV